MKTSRIFIMLLTLCILIGGLTSCDLVDHLLFGIYYDDSGVQYVRSEAGDFYYLTNATECKATTYTVPATFKGKPVKIQTGAFSLNTSIEALIVSEGVTGNSKCFTSPSIKTITLPDHFALPGFAFYYCTALTTIEFPTDITSIPSGTFKGCKSLKELVIPEGITKLSDMSGGLPDGLFAECSSLEKITLPASLTYIDSCTFANCKNLTAIYFSDTAGWCVSGEPIDVTNPLINAQELGSGGSLINAELKKQAVINSYK